MLCCSSKVPTLAENCPTTEGAVLHTTAELPAHRGSAKHAAVVLNLLTAMPGRSPTTRDPVALKMNRSPYRASAPDSHPDWTLEQADIHRGSCATPTPTLGAVLPGNGQTSVAHVAADEPDGSSGQSQRGVGQRHDKGALVGGDRGAAAGDGIKDQAWEPSGGSAPAELENVEAGAAVALAAVTKVRTVASRANPSIAPAAP